MTYFAKHSDRETWLGVSKCI